MALRVGVTLALLGYLIVIADAQVLLQTLRHSTWWGIPAALGTFAAGLWVASLRWYLLLLAYGAVRRPRLSRLLVLYAAAHPYNMLPGAVGGDVIRGIVTRDAFGDDAPGAGLAVVFVERLLGLTGLTLLSGGALYLHPIANVQLSWPLGLLGLTAGVVAVAAIAAGRQLGHRLGGRLGHLLGSFPRIRSFRWFALAVACSMGTQALVGVMSHIFIAPLAPHLGLADSLVLAPLAFAASYFPLTVAGAGTRDAAMVALYSLVGVDKATALAASLQVLLVFLLMAAVGAVVGALSPLRASE